MLEIYQTQVLLHWHSSRMLNRFFWLVNNTTLEHPYSVAMGINNAVVSSFFWFDFYTLLISETARFRLITTRRARPGGGPRAVFRFPGGGVLGQWPFDCGDNFTGVKIQWLHDNNFTGKNQNRLGPLGTGATGDRQWNPLFSVAVFNFGAAHGTPMMTASGLSFQSCNVDKLGIASVITGAQLTWPPCRQKTRRPR